MKNMVLFLTDLCDVDNLFFIEKIVSSPYFEINT